MHGEDGMMVTEQRATIGATWGGSDWGIHVSSDVNYTLDDGTEGTLTAKVYEAYASTDLMGYANLTIGRQALDYGSGAILSSNQWGTRTTHDGMKFDLGLDVADIDVWYSNTNAGTPDVDGESAENSTGSVGVNIAKAEGDWSANLLYVKGTTTLGGAEMEGTDNGSGTAMGMDLGYTLMGGSLDLGVSYNTNSGNTGTEDEEDMMSLSATYNVSDALSVTASQTTYGENGFDVDGTNQAAGWAGGNMGYLGADDQNRSIGMNYTMGDFNLGVTMNMISNTGDDDEGSTANADYERNVTVLDLGYTMSDNASLSLKYATDDVASDDLTDADKYMWLSLNIRP
jgi:hypothetical protein